MLESSLPRSESVFSLRMPSSMERACRLFQEVRMDPRSRCRSGMVDGDGVEGAVSWVSLGVAIVIVREEGGVVVGVRVLLFCRKMWDMAVAGKCR